jgi:ribosome-binding factor A
MAGRRPERVAEQIKEEVSQIVLGGMRDGRVGFVTVTDAEVSPDLRHARIYVSVLGSTEQVNESMEALKAASGFIRRQVGKGLRLRYTPELHFVYDETIRNATRIEEILKEEGDKLRERERTDSPGLDRS